MNNGLPEDCSKQWEILLLLISSEEKKIDRTNDTEIDTMNYFLSNRGIRHILIQWLKDMKESFAKKTQDLDTALKCDDISLKWRQRGNDKFRSNSIEDSYLCYTKSVIYAQHGGTMYPLALANRSAALFRMKRFQECLSDIKMAITCGYPEEQRHKLLLRQADCQLQLAQGKSAKASLIAAKNHATQLNLSSAHNADFERHVRELERKLDLANLSRDNAANHEDLILPHFCEIQENDHFVSATNTIELRNDDRVGRHVIARESMKRGDTLFVEEPYACVLIPSYERDNEQERNATCEKCCKRNINIVPCAVCSRSWYCSEECRSRAMNTYHNWECVGSQMDLFKTIGIAHLALRVLLVATSDGFPKVAETSNRMTAEELFRTYSIVDTVKIYERDTPPFYRMFNLITNLDKMTNTDYIQYALTATMLMFYLENHTSFFDVMMKKMAPLMVNSRSEVRLFAAALLFRAMGQLVCNGHAIIALTDSSDKDNSRTASEMEVRLATAIYPTVAMMNHSCDPNIVNTFQGNRLIVRCSKDISSGSEVFNCYGPHRSRETRANRRVQLKAQYMFKCTCTACSDNQRRDFVSLFSAYACQSCKGPVIINKKDKHALCQQCRCEFQLDRALNIIQRADDLIIQAENCSSLEEKCEMLNASLKLKQQVWHRHHKSLRLTMDTLARLYSELGDLNRSVELIKQNIQSLEYQFGSFSVEVGHELRKLSNVMVERLIITSSHHQEYREWCLETHNIIKKAIHLMELNYGPWETIVKRLKEQEMALSAIVSQNSHISTIDINGDNGHHNMHNLKI